MRYFCLHKTQCSPIQNQGTSEVSENNIITGINDNITPLELLWHCLSFIHTPLKKMKGNISRWETRKAAKFWTKMLNKTCLGATCRNNKFTKKKTVVKEGIREALDKNSTCYKYLTYLTKIQAKHRLHLLSN